MEEEDLDSAYAVALTYMAAGKMPVIVDASDGMHVVSLVPTDRESLTNMIHPDLHRRLNFIVSAIITVKGLVEANA